MHLSRKDSSSVLEVAAFVYISKKAIIILVLMNPTNQNIQRIIIQTPNVVYHNKQNKEVRWWPMYTSSSFSGEVSSGNLFWKTNYSMATKIWTTGRNNRNFPSDLTYMLAKTGNYVSWCIRLVSDCFTMFLEHIHRQIRVANCTP